MTQTTRVTAAQLAEFLARLSASTLLFPDMDFEVTTDDKVQTILIHPITEVNSDPS